MSGWEEGAERGRTSPARGSGDAQSIGSYLARQRDLRGISLEELAQLTRIPIRSLARLESGSYDGVTDGFVRGFVRSVAESLGLEPDDTVARMLSEPNPSEEVGAPSSVLLRRALLPLLALVVLAAAVVLARGLLPLSGSRDAGEVEQVFRRDAVRQLAESQRAALHRASTTAQVEAPEASAPQADSHAMASTSPSVLEAGRAHDEAQAVGSGGRTRSVEAAEPKPSSAADPPPSPATDPPRSPAADPPLSPAGAQPLSPAGDPPLSPAGESPPSSAAAIE